MNYDEFLWSIGYEGNIKIGDYERFATAIIGFGKFSHHYKEMSDEYIRTKGKSTMVLVKWFHSNKWPRMAYKVSHIFNYNESSRIYKLTLL